MVQLQTQVFYPFIFPWTDPKNNMCWFLKLPKDFSSVDSAFYHKTLLAI